MSDAKYVMNRLLDFMDVFEEWECTGNPEECAECPLGKLVYENPKKRNICDVLIDIAGEIEEDEE